MTDTPKPSSRRRRSRGRGKKKPGDAPAAPVDPHDEMQLPPAPVRPTVDPVGFKLFDLHPLLYASVGRMGFSKPTPIQEEAIPVAMTGRDLIGLAQTGTGKTAAYLLPALHRLMSDPEPPEGTRLLILAPTRELAMQIERDVLEISSGTSLTCVLLIGGQKLTPQFSKLLKKPPVIIATPGRLLDHIERRTASLSNVQTLVIDECDRMLDMGFLPDVRRILRRTPTEKQTMMFSATLPSAIRDLMRDSLRNPETIQISIGELPDGVKHGLYRVPQKMKTDLLLDLLKNKDMESVLVFTRTKHRADLVHHYMKEARINATKIHGDLSMRERLKALQDFRERKYTVLIATDLASRGLDIKDITHVINYDVPLSAEDYVHRVGRTGRAESEGDAFTFAAIEEDLDVRAIEKLLGHPIPPLYHEEFKYPGEVPGSSAPAPDRKPLGRGLSGGSRLRRRR